jgi:hypothetical protein
VNTDVEFLLTRRRDQQKNIYTVDIQRNKGIVPPLLWLEKGLNCWGIEVRLPFDPKIFLHSIQIGSGSYTLDTDRSFSENKTGGV